MRLDAARACVILKGIALARGRHVSAILKDAAHWKERAEDARRVAAQLTEPEDRARMLEIAENYERLAVRAQVRAEAELSGPAPTVIGRNALLPAAGTTNLPRNRAVQLKAVNLFGRPRD